MRQGRALRLYLTESDRIDGKPALEALADLCRKHDIRGLSVWRGVEGIGRHGLHAASFLSLASDLPLIVEIVGSEAQIERALAVLRPHLGDRVAACWPVSILRGEEESE